MADTSPTVAPSSPSSDDGTRFALSKWVVTFAFIIIGVLGLAALIAVIYIAASKTAMDSTYTNVKDILSLLLPVVGTWVGTVLAFYFTRENFESAAKNTAALVQQLTPDQKLRSLSVTDAMITIDKMTYLSLADDSGSAKLKGDMITKMESDPKAKRERLPMLDAQGHIRYIAHRSTIDSFLVLAQSAVPPNPDPTLKDMVANPDYRQTLASFGTRPPTSTLSEAKALIDANPKCADVFITDDGTPATKVVGWITDDLITKKSMI